MALNNASISIGATFAPTGGSATSLKTKRLDNNVHTLYLDDGSPLVDQTTFEFTTKEPKVNSGAPNGYTQARNILLVRDPFALDNGNTTVNTGKIEISVDHELTAAEKKSMREKLIHALNDSEFEEFWDEQSSA